MIKFLLFLIIASSAVLRFYGGADLFFWHVDEDILGLTIKRILVDHSPTLIGMTIPGGIHLGPGYFYLTSIFFAFSSMNPLILPTTSLILATLLAWLIYRTAEIIFESRTLGIIALIIFSFSYLMNVYSRIYDPLIFTPIMACLVYIILYKNIKNKQSFSANKQSFSANKQSFSANKKQFLLPILAIILAWSLQGEGTPLSLIFLAAACWLIWKYKVSRKNLLILTIGIFISILPLLIFELRHDFIQSKRLLNFVEKPLTEKNIGNNSFISSIDLPIKTLSRIIDPSGNPSVADQILPCPELIKNRVDSITVLPYITAILSVAFFFLRQIFTKAKTIGEQITTLHVLIIVSGLFIFNFFIPDYFHEWQLMILFPSLIYIIAYNLNWLYQKGALGKFLVITFIIIFSFLNLKFFFKTNSNFGLASKVEAVKFALSQVNGQPFYLESLGSCYGQGYLYLFWYLGQLPTYTEGLIFNPQIISLPNGTKPEIGVIIANPSDDEPEDYFKKYQFYKLKAVNIRQIGKIEVLIVDTGKPLE